LDLRGAALCLAAAGGGLFAVLSAPSQGFLSLAVLTSAAFSIICALWARSWLRRAPQPLIDVSLFRAPRFSRALLLIFLGYFTFSGVSFVLAQYLQLERAKGALRSGLMTLPLTGSMLLGTLLAPTLLRHLRAERALRASLSAAFLGAALLTCASHIHDDLLLCIALVPFGAGSGSAFANATELILSSVSRERAGTAAAVSESAFEFGGVLGIAVLSSVLGNPSHPDARLAMLAPHALGVGAFAVFLAWWVARRVTTADGVRATQSACSDP
jgi:DHA2 family multidrug resistance protein-like MFS transporter